MTTLLLSAGDASGDMHAAAFVKEFRARHPHSHFFGLGGEEMERAGVELVAHQRDLAVGGILELVGSGRRVLRSWQRMSAALSEVAPDLVVLTDSGGFNIPFARIAKRRAALPVLYYVAPQVWAWRRGRIRKLARRVDRMAVIFPFEPEVYASTALNVEFVGHPLVDRLGELSRRLDREGARRELELGGDGPLVAILPGSRRNEIAHQLPVQLAAACRLFERNSRVQFALGLAPSISPQEVARIADAAGLPPEMRLDTVAGRTHDLIAAADLVLAKPGTVTVEVALLERPMVVVGKANPLTAAIVRRAVKLPSLSMPNLILDEPIVPEFLQEEARPPAIAAAMEELLTASGRERQLAGLARVKGRLGPGGAAARVAQIAEEMLGDSAT